MGYGFPMGLVIAMFIAYYAPLLLLVVLPAAIVAPTLILQRLTR